MTWQFRKSKTVGPFRVTAGKHGLSTSVGIGPFRLSRGSDGRTRRTVRVPGTGIYSTEVIDNGEDQPSQPAPAKKRRPWQLWFLAACLAFLVFVILI